MDNSLSANIEEYLEWIYRLSMEQKKVTSSDLARSLHVSPASVTNMLKRLVERGLVNHRPYGGITLTEEGRSVGARIIRRHGLLERLLCDVLGFPWNRVDDAVRHIEHYITDEVEERLAQFLNYPTTCPHGQPLDWEHAGRAMRLSELGIGQEGVVTRIGDESPDFLDYVASIGLLPGQSVKIARQEPFGGPTRALVGDAEQTLGVGTLSSIWIDRDSVR